MKKFSKFLSILLCLSMLIGILPTLASAAEICTYKLTAAESLTAGTYLIYGVSSQTIDETNVGAFMSVENATSTRLMSAQLTVSGDTVSTSDTNCAWNLISTTGGFYIQSASTGNYLYYGSNSGNNIYTTGDISKAGVWSVVANGDYWTLQEAASGRQLSCNRFGSDGSYYYGFASYASTSSTARNLTFYKLNSGTVNTPDPTVTPTDAPSDDPAADSTLTITEAIALGASKEHNTYTTGKYYVTGVITNVYNTTYGNMYIKDEAGNTLTIYGTYDADGTNRYDAMATKPGVGDTVTVYGVIGQYNGTPQMKNGWITEHIPTNVVCEHKNVSNYLCGDCGVVVPPSANSTLTIPQATTLGLAHVSSGYTTDKFYVTGVITEVYNTTYGNMYITDDAGNTLCIYGTYDADGTNRYDAMTTQPVAGDTVTVYGVIGQYNGTAQMKNGWITAHTAAAPGQTDPSCNHESVTAYLCDNCGELVPPAAGSTLSITEALALGALTGSSAYTTEKYYVTGVITEVYNTTYGNMYIADDAGNTLCIYGTYDADGTNRYDAMTTQPVAGDTVTVYGVIGQYNGTPQMKNGWVTEHTPGHTHSYTSAVTKEATCTTNGVMTYTCECSDSYTETITKLGHSFTAYTSNGDATCTADGTKTAKCDRCTKKDTVADTGSALGHSWQNATCTTAKTCRTCGITNGAPLGHSYTLTSTVPATCSAEGASVYTCGTCGDSYSTPIAIDDEAHSYTVTVFEPTCSSQGYSHHVCSYCGDDYNSNYTDELDCVDADGDNVCDVCNETICIHDYQLDPDACTPATCTKDGTNVKKCTECGKTKNETVSSNGHSYSDWSVVTSATCTSEGSESRTCSTCGRTEYSPIAALGHNYESVVTEPGCTTEGYTTHTCSTCSHSYTDNDTAALGHNLTKVEAKKPTLENEGCIEYYICSNCDKWYHNADSSNEITDKSSIVIPKLTVSDPATITFDDPAKRTEISNDKQVWNDNNITVTNSKDSSTTNVADYYNPVRFYKNSTVTVSSSGINTITFFCNNNDSLEYLSAVLADNDQCTVTVIGKAVYVELNELASSFTVVLSAGQVRLDSVSINTAAPVEEEEPAEPTDPSEPTQPSEPSTEIIEVTTATPVETPEAGVAYKLGLEQGNLNTSLYFIGTSANQSYYLSTSEIADEAVDVYLEEVNGGYQIYFYIDGVKTYIDIYLTDTGYVNLNLTTEPTAVYIWNSEYSTLTTSIEKDGELTEYYIGTYNTFSTLSASKLSYITTSFPCHLYTLSTEEVEVEVVPPAEDGDEDETNPTVPDTGSIPADGATLTVKDAIAAAQAGAAGKYYVTGVVTSINNTVYGNLYIEDDTGSLFIYGMYNEDGSVRFDAMDVQPQVGDTVTVYTALSMYGTTPEAVNAWLVELVSGGNTSGDSTKPNETVPSNPTQPSEPTTEIIVVTTATPVETPKAGVAYKLGLEQGNLETSLYFIGTSANQSYYLSTSEIADEGVDVYLEEVNGGYQIYFYIDGVKTYIDIYLTDTGYVNLNLTTEPTAVYIWNSEYSTLTTSIEKDGELTEYYMGTYNTFSTLSASKLSYIATSFPCHLYTLSTEEVEVEVVPPTQNGGENEAPTASVTLNSSDLGLENAQEWSGITINGITFTASSGDNGRNAPTYYDNGSALRFYSKNSLTISAAAGYSIKTITITGVADFAISADNCQITNATAEGLGTATVVLTPEDGTADIVLTNIADKGNFRILSIDVAYSSSTTSGGTTVLVPTAVKVETPTAGTAYKLGFNQANLGTTLYFTGAMDGYYLATSESLTEAVDIYLETVEGGLRIYFMDDSTKTYIDVIPREGVEGKVNVVLTTAPTCVYTFSSTYGTFVTTVEGNDWYLGTYNQYSTISASLTSYIEDTSKIGVSQFPVNCYTVKMSSQTGDTINVFVALLAISAIGAAVIVTKKKEF